MSGQYPTNAELRAWAEQRKPGVVSARGTLPHYLIVAWDRVHPDRPYVKSQAYHGSTSGYNDHHCRCDDCYDAINAYSRDTYALRAADRAEELADQFTDADA